MNRLPQLCLLVCCFASLVNAVLADDSVWKRIDTGSTSSLRGISAVDSQTAWVSGSNGSILRTNDAGQTWIPCAPPGNDKTEFRCIHAWSATEAIVANSGSPGFIARTTDGGKRWQTVYENPHVGIFFDAMRFANRDVGYAYSDPIDGRFFVLQTKDAGQSWSVLQMIVPTPDAGEAGFAASNSTLAVVEPSHIWIGLGGSESGKARVLKSSDSGHTWTISSVAPMNRSASSGIFSLCFRDPSFGIAVGGDYKQMDAPESNIAVTLDGGISWRLPTNSRPRGYRSSVLYCGDTKMPWICCGPTGCDWSLDGDEWIPLSDVGFHSLARASDGTVWASGANGRVAKLVR